MAKRKARGTAPRSKKAGKPPRDLPASRQAKRRRVSATAAVKKDTELKQTDAGTKVLWGANQRRPSKV